MIPSPRRRLTLSQYSLRRFGFAVTGLGLWLNDKNGSTHLIGWASPIPGPAAVVNSLGAALGCVVGLLLGVLWLW